MAIEFSSDRVKISGPRIDGNYTVTFDVGEYQKINLSELFKLPDGVVYKVRVEVEK